MVICEKFVNDSDHIQGNVIEPTMMLLDDKKFWSNPKRDENDNETIVKKGEQDVASFKISDIHYVQAAVIISFHIGSAYGIYLLLTGQAKLATLAFSFVLAALASTGITAGAHRLWAHKSYKAKWQLRLLLMILTSMTFQGTIYSWVRDHRVHHKFTETNADPHNASRGFFFAHVGWLMLRKHPDVRAKGKTIDLSDLKHDGIVMFQKKHYMWLMLLGTFILPTIAIQYLFDESFSAAFFSGSLLKYLYAVHVTWSINSFAHFFGHRPYDKNIHARDNVLFGIIGFGEGWHNYHHVFPWDYKTSELGNYSTNFTLAFINFFAKLGWAYEMKTVSEAIITKRAKKSGDGTHSSSNDESSSQAEKGSKPQARYQENNSIWGWDDKALDVFDKNHALILNKID